MAHFLRLARLMRRQGMSFLDVQDLATATAQSGLVRLLSTWCAESDALLGVLEFGVVAVLVGVALRARRGNRR